MPWTPLLGKVGWSVQTGVNPSANLQTGAAPTLANGVLYVASSGGIVYTIDPARHAILWQSQASSGMQPPPAVVDGTVYVVTTDGMIQALRASDGKVSWSVPISGRMYAGPVTDAQT
jgi:outer membrane protein assembly factor BamB